MNEMVFSPSHDASSSAQERASHTIADLICTDLSNPASLVAAIREGLEISIFEAVSKLGIPRKELEWVINPRTLSHRKKNNQKLTPVESDRLVRVALIVELANEVFADSDKAHRWLHKSKQRYNGLSPFEMMQSEHGAQSIEDDLNRIDAGIAA